MQVTDPLLTAREGAKYLQVSLPTFYRRIADGTRCRSRLRWEAYPAGRSRKFWRQSEYAKAKRNAGSPSPVKEGR